jgi:DNA-directed RNA polymerase subunit alpha
MERKKNYQSLISPRITWNEQYVSSPTYGECTLKPLESSFGHTIANTLRRVLLGGIEASAISSVIIEGANNEFSTLPGVYDDLLTILLRLQQVTLKNATGSSGVIQVDVKGPGEVRAGDFICDEHIEVVNKDFVITSLDKEASLKMTLFVTSGRGYHRVDWNDKRQYQEDGKIFLNATYSPVLNVAFDVQKTRLGSDIGYDQIILKITTNGAISPKDVFDYAVSVILNQFQGLLGQTETITFNDKLLSGAAIDKNVGQEQEAKDKFVFPSLKENFSPDFFLKSIDILGLPARAHNCLISAQITRIIDLVNMSEQDILKLKNFGKKSYDDLIQVMKELGLSFEMNINEKQVLKYLENA